MENGQLEQFEDEIGALVEHLEIGWTTRVGKPDLFSVKVSGRTYDNPHPILREIFDVLGMQKGVEQNIKLSSLRKRYALHFGESLKKLDLHLTMGKVKNLSWEDSHALCFEIIWDAR